MYIVGIDIGKNHHETSIIDYSGKLVGRSCRFSNTHKGADKLTEYLTGNIGESTIVLLILNSEIIKIGFILILC